MNQSLTRMLALICLHLNPRARTRLLDLLPETLQTEVRDWQRRRGDELIAGELSPVESRVLSSFGKSEFKGQIEGDFTGDSSRQDRVPPEQVAGEDAEVENFFNEAEERLEGAVDELAQLGAWGSPMLPASLISLILLDADPVEAARLLVELPAPAQGRSVDLMNGSGPPP